MALTGKVSLVIVSIIILVASSISVFIIREEKKLLESELKKRGAEIARNLSRLSIKPVLHEEVWGLYGLIKEIIKGEDPSSENIVAYAMVLNRKGEVLAHSDPKKFRVWSPLEKNSLNEMAMASQGLLIQTIHQDVEGDQIYDVALPIFIDNERIGVVRVGVTRRYVDAALERITLNIILITGILGLMGVALGVILTGRVTRPLRKLTDFVRGISSGRLDRRIEISPDGEIGQLTSAFNQMAIDLDKRTREIAESERKYRSLFDFAEDSMMRLDRSGKVLAVNKREEWIIGYHEDELLGKELTTILPERYWDLFINIFRETIDKNKKVPTSEIEVVSKDGRLIPMELDLTGICEGDRVVSVQIHLRDITKRKLLEKQVEQSRRLSDLGEFAGGIAHEVRNPLARIMMGAYTLKEAAPDKGERARALDNILKGVVDLNRFVTELLNYTGRMELQRDKTDINKILDSTLFNLTEEAVRSRVKITLKLDPELPKANVDGVKMDQVFSNIIRNAIQAMPDGGALTIITDYKPCPVDMHMGMKGKTNGVKPGLIKISLSDTGSGISKKDIGKIFNPFFTTRAKGIGLGLVLVHRIVEAHGGKIDVESREGEGCIFKILLPFVPDYQYHDEEEVKITPKRNSERS
ncbi:MAG: PAS domain S-box protein [Nitrospirae bacterium]|nr:PAS domain S-box protein [Nitrospirota bacterium]